ncbi:two-component sensor histidine kinase [Variovorax sp. WS11]|uniref:heavy metal sensor histidine kinase n=1 Tax=Variovorax sp. WS11 TaxID=1105204 RepID=UPI000D0D8BAB|nr:heavy metal sensor histidine kinase [Variovorax sp. WS11]NDZ17420.1 heavy metal sensor histidine kinase [Variovorax sp. WS11]PSL86045.1 two-component sensor histidine kinase [Variovorax sp. WS11]
MKWLPRSLAVRATLLLALIACAVTSVLGAYFFYTARAAITEHLDTQLIGRVEHFRRLVSNVQTIADLHDRPLLFETMLGAERDVLLLRRPGEAPFIDVNPGRFPVPGTLAAAADDQDLAIKDVLTIPLADGVPMHWAAALARSGRDGDMVEVVAGHPLTNEVKMIRANRDRVVFGALFAMLASTLLAYLVLRHGLRPLRRVAEKAASINPINLAVRLPEHDAPREVQHMVIAFNAMLDRIATGYERLSQFSADLAHEIRTPIGALIGQTQVALQRARNADEYQHLLESNLEELNRLRQIAENILFLAQADHASLAIEREPMALHGELQKIAEYFEGPADEGGLRFDVRAAGVAFVNAALCRRAINNLVVNAVRHGARGTTVRLIGEQEGDMATIAVENEGPPVPPEQLGRLFDRFYRGDAARSRYTESNGLGLAIVKAIMALHGGEVRASCPTPSSIRFELRFPAAGAPAVDPLEAQAVTG